MLSIAGRRILLTIHILLNGIWTGGIAAILFLNVAKSVGGGGEGLAAADHVLFRIHDAVVMNVGIGVIVTGFLFSLFTRWGFFDFYWVIVKWMGLGIVVLLITVFLAPSVNGMAALSDVQGVEALQNATYRAYERDATLYSSILLALLTIIIGVSVFKPWGARKKPFRVSRRTVLVAAISTGTLLVGGTILQSVELERYRTTPVSHVDPASLVDGTYTGEVRYGIDYRVRVRVQDHRIHSIDILSDQSDFYPRLAGYVIGRVLDAQTPDVAAITGATTSSKGLLKAIERALARQEQED